MTVAYMASREAWERAYDEAMQWRDWQTCEQMIEEREQADWHIELYKQTVTKTAISPITKKEPRDVGAPGATT